MAMAPAYSASSAAAASAATGATRGSHSAAATPTSAAIRPAPAGTVHSGGSNA